MILIPRRCESCCNCNNSSLDRDSFSRNFKVASQTSQNRIGYFRARAPASQACHRCCPKKSRLTLYFAAVCLDDRHACRRLSGTLCFRSPTIRPPRQDQQRSQAVLPPPPGFYLRGPSKRLVRCRGRRVHTGQYPAHWKTTQSKHGAAPTARSLSRLKGVPGASGCSCGHRDTRPGA